MILQFTNSQDFTTASEKQVKEKWPKIPHWFLSQRDNFLVCATTRYRDSLSSGMAGSSILFHEIYLLAPVHALSFASLPPLETWSVTGWMISPQQEESGPPMARPEPHTYPRNQRWSQLYHNHNGLEKRKGAIFQGDIIPVPREGKWMLGYKIHTYLWQWYRLFIKFKIKFQCFKGTRLGMVIS